MSVTRYPAQSFDKMSRKQAITTCYALEDMRDRALARNERQRATLAGIRALCRLADGMGVDIPASDLLAALDPTS